MISTEITGKPNAVMAYDVDEAYSQDTHPDAITIWEGDEVYAVKDNMGRLQVSPNGKDWLTDVPSDCITPIFEVGDWLVCEQEVRYFMGQAEDDCIREGEMVVVDGVRKDRRLTFRQHADRYGPYPPECFRYATPKELQAYEKQQNQSQASGSSWNQKPQGVRTGKGRGKQ